MSGATGAGGAAVTGAGAAGGAAVTGAGATGGASTGGAAVCGTLTEARIYEEQGHREQALEIIKQILSREPANTAARDALLRLSGLRVRRDNGVNFQMLEFLRAASTPAQMNEIRRWLVNI